MVDELGSEEGESSRGTPTKGVGLKKWKRIRRNVVQDTNSSGDSGKMLKRGLSGNANSSENQLDVKEKCESSIGNVEFSNDYVIRGSSSDSRYTVGSDFMVETDSENNEERSSKSSMVASQPILRSAKSRSKNVSSKNLGNSGEWVQQGKGWIESSKKHGGGERVKMEKKNSLSNIESDSRSSNFKQGIFTATSNGNHRGRSNLYDGDNDGEVQTNEHFTAGVQVGYGNEKVGEDEDIAEERSENNQSETVEDTFVESISSLQAIQAALEEEVLKFREIGIEVVSPYDDSAKCRSTCAGITDVDLGPHNSCISGESSAEEIKQCASSSLEFQALSLAQNVNILENKLEELRGILALKDSRIAELEKCKEVESELEGLFRQKIEAEVEYLAITKVMKNLKVGEDFELTLLEEQEQLTENQAQVLNKAIEAESKASVLKNKAEELEKYSDDSKVVELQKSKCKVTFYLFIQFMLLILSFWLFMSQLLLNSGVVVPT